MSRQYRRKNKRPHRHDAIVSAMTNGNLITAAQLADALKVSERTIYRDMHTLERKFSNIIGEAGIGYIMRGHTAREARP